MCIFYIKWFLEYTYLEPLYKNIWSLTQAHDLEISSTLKKIEGEISEIMNKLSWELFHSNDTRSEAFLVTLIYGSFQKIKIKLTISLIY